MTAEATKRVLIVDDDPNVLMAYDRRLRKRFEVETALCSEEGVTAVNFLGPFAVVVSDMQMPRENGAQFLHKLRSLAPETVRIMLTGNADQATAADAINQGQVFRFLNKPCEANDLSAAIADGIEEHLRRVAEKNLLRETVLGAVGILSRVLSVTNPDAFGRAERLRAFAQRISNSMGVADSWEYETAALLSQLGFVSLPDAAKHGSTQDKTKQAQRHEFAAELIDEVPRLHNIARMVRLAGEGCSSKKEDISEDVKLGAELIRLGEAYDYLTVDQDVQPQLALERINSSENAYHTDLLSALHSVIEKEEEKVLAQVSVDELTDQMSLAEHVETTDGAMLVAKGQQITPTLRKRLSHYCETHEVKQPIHVLVTTPAAPAGV